MTAPVDERGHIRSESNSRRTVAWPLWLLAAPAFVAVWSAWVGLGRLSGFGMVQPLPGIWDGLELDTSITLPIGVEAYAAYALRIWLVGDCTARAINFARRSTIAALCLGAAGQIVYHLLTAAGVTRAPWPVTALVAVLPVVVLGFGASLAHLVQQTPPVEGEVHEPESKAPEQGSRVSVAPPALPSSGAAAPTTVPKTSKTAGDGTAARVRSLLVDERQMTTAAIAFQLGISERTARRHRATVLKNLHSTDHVPARAPEAVSAKQGEDTQVDDQRAKHEEGVAA